MASEAFAYILAGNKTDDGQIPIYIGSTTDLARRVWEHKQGIGSRHTAKYRIHKLVWYEAHESIETAKWREHRIKRWRRVSKEEEIAKLNPEWRDLYNTLH